MSNAIRSEHVFPEEGNFASLNISKELQSFLETRNASVVEFTDTFTGETRKFVSFSHSQELPIDLPHGYGFSGGTARGILLAEMGEKTQPPRDYDIVAVEQYNPDTSLMESLSRKYMSRDNRYGYGVSTENIKDYFSKRDFVMNEVVVVGDSILATPEALQDLADKVVRPTNYEQDRWYSNYKQIRAVNPKLIVKALRIQLEFEEMYGYGSLEGIEDWQYETGAVPAFYIALGLEKAFDRGDSMAFSFFKKLIEKGTIASRYSLKETQIRANSPQELALALRWQMEQDDRRPFVFSREVLNESHSLEQFVKKHPGLSEEDIYDYYSDLTASLYPKIKGLPAKERYERGEITSIVDEQDGDDSGEEIINEDDSEGSSSFDVPTAMEHAMLEAMKRKRK